MRLPTYVYFIILTSITAMHVSCNSKLEFLASGKINGKVKSIVQTIFDCEYIEGELKILNTSIGRDNCEFSYNKFGNIIYKNYHEPNELKSTRYYYNNKNRISRSETTNRNDSIFWSETYTYNSFYLLIDHKISNSKYGSHSTYKYFPNQNLKSKTKREIQHNRTTHFSYRYYDTGKLEEVKELNEKGEIKRKINYNYFPGSHFKTVTISFPNSERDTNVFKYHIRNKQFAEENINKGYTITDTYNLNGDKMGYRINNKNGSRSTRYTYVYDKRNNWIEKVEYRWSGEITMYKRNIEYY